MDPKAVGGRNLRLAVKIQTVSNNHKTRKVHAGVKTTKAIKQKDSFCCFAQNKRLFNGNELTPE
ncbi:hypothetical protein GCM10023231_09040 [Olivibacter ginsenosidimutans]|uniref:Uncharacterized protein n=1 Tax=Olivibacter ginsenosidimutans TaxID=1176537 RepID=A0ABP9ANR1_9SPHI